jgi:hypothetical protein
LALPATIFAAAALSQSANEDPSAAAFAAISVNEATELREGVTLAQWMNTRGKTEHWETRKPLVDPLYPRQECLWLDKTEALPSGAKVRRGLYFYPPQSKSPFLFPAASVPQLLSTCILGGIRVEAEASDAQTGQLLDQAVRQRLTKLYGESVDGKTVPIWGRRLYGGAGRWTPHAEIVSRYDSNESKAPDQFVLGPVASVRARLPLARTQDELSIDRPPASDSTADPDFRRLIAMAGTDAGLSDRFNKAYEQIFQTLREVPDRQSAKSRFVVLQDWISAGKNMPPTRRAAGLLAAELFLDITCCGRIAGWPEQGKERSELQNLGARFQFFEPGNNYNYIGNWSKQARQLDPNGPVGQMVILRSMAHEDCWKQGWGSTFFYDVIRDGERLLAKGLDIATATLVHFMVGDAYSEVVAAAGGLVGPNGEYSAPPAEGEIDRGKALQHYRAGLAIDNTSMTAKDAWSQAWRLSAGPTPPRAVRLFRRLREHRFETFLG